MFIVYLLRTNAEFGAAAAASSASVHLLAVDVNM